MGFLTRLLAGLTAAAALGAGLTGTANAVDAAGAASDTTGAVTTTADDTGGRTVLDCRQSGEGATGPYADKFCWIDWSNLPLDSSGKPTPVRINVPGGHIDADATITHTDNAALTAKDYTGSKWSRLTSAYKLTGNTALAFSGRMGRQDPAASVTFSNVTPSADRTDTGVNVLKDFQLAFGDAEVMSGGVLQGHDVYERTDIESDKTLEKLGMIGSGDPNQSYSKANTGYGTTHVTLAGGPKGATDDANKDSKGAAVVGAKQASRFKVSFGQVNQHWDGWGSAIAVGVYMPYLTAYPLTYDKNSSDAAGEVPSNQRGKENTTQPAKTKTNGKIRLASDDMSGLPDHLVNGDFSVNYKDQWLTGGWNWTSITPDGKYLNSVRNWNDSATTWKTVNGWDKTKFGWSSTQKDGTDNIQHKAGAVEIQYDDLADNVYAELCAYEAGTAIYQDIKTVPGTLYKVRLKHASLYDGYLDKMQVMIGAPGHEQPVEMTRTGVNGNGDKLNEKSNIIATKVSNTGENDRNHDSQWESYEGTYLIPAGQTVTRFTFRSVGSRNLDHGNLLDDIVFDKAYRLDYDKNASDATGEVPSNQRGRENTVQPAKDKTSGSVKLVADDDVAEYAANGLPKQIMNGDFDHDWRNIVGQSRMSEKYNFANVDPAHGDVEISGALNGKGEASKQWVHLNGFDASRFGWKSNQTDTRVDGRGGIVEIQRSRANDNMYAEITASQADTYLYQDIDTAHDYPTVYTVKLRYAHRNGTINSNEKIQILVGAPGHEQPVEMTRIASDRGNRLGEKSTTVNAPNTDGWLGSWDTFQGSVVVPAGRNVSRFTFKALGSIDGISGNLIDDVQFKLAYKLSYDKNSQDAFGQVPSDETANTVKQAKTRTTGTVRAVADRTASGLTVHDLETDDVPGDYRQFVLNTTDTRLSQTASSKSTGKVSDLVQRTTTHEDGSVTVKTIDTSTDVVSGCQVYYPAGQKITLATMAKDDDCWDSSMLSRPGHTQLGWNQDRNATQAQTQVTMVEGGMTVYAVWVGNPVLTYDTNKPSTFGGQMPSTPASVSVPYNTAAADGSGWRSGDTTMLKPGGYKFLGWYTGPQDDAGLYDWNTPLTGNVTVYAHWQRLQANVVYDANGGTGSHANTTGWQYSDVTVPSDTSKSFTRTGYRFAGWNTAKDGKGTAYKDGSQVPLQAGDVTLYAQWEPLFDVLPSAGGDYGPTVPWLVCGGLALIALAGGVASTLLRLRRARGAHSR